MYELKPCPFCGNVDDFEGSPFPSRNRDYWIVRCGVPSCNAQVLGGTPAAAVVAWNRRTGERPSDNHSRE